MSFSADMYVCAQCNVIKWNEFLMRALVAISNRL